MNGANAIEVRGLRKAYGESVAVKGVDLHVARGEVFALLGPNGAGKTTLLQVASAQMHPTDGVAGVLDEIGRAHV